MKKLIFLLLFSAGAYAQTIHRVTNGMNLNALITAANIGDVFLVEPGEYGSLVIEKEVKVFGTGYFLNISNDEYTGTSNFTNVYIRPTATSATIIGLNVSGDIYVGANQALISRCKSSSIRLGSNQGTAVKTSNVLISQNYMGGITIDANSENFLIKNNIILGGFQISTTEFGQIINNNFGAGLSIGGYFFTGTGYVNVTFKNNIFYRRANNIYSPNFMYSVRPFITAYNLFDTTFDNPVGLSPTNSIISSSEFLNVYLGAPNNPNNLQEDARYQLAPNSPARGAGENGTDCGAFGGDDPYVLSGIPDIPSIYQLTVPSQVPQNEHLNVQIKAKTNN